MASVSLEDIITMMLIVLDVVMLEGLWRGHLMQCVELMAAYITEKLCSKISKQAGSF